MKRFLVPAAVAAAVFSSGMALASTSTTGTIEKFDLKAHQLILTGGVAYELPSDFKDPGLKVGEKVTLAWDQSGAMKMIKTVTVAQ